MTRAKGQGADGVPARSTGAPGASDRQKELCGEGVLSIEDAMKFSDLSRTELYERMKDGRLAWLKHGKRRLIPKRALVEMLAGNVVGGEGS